MARKDLNFLKDNFKLELADPQYTELVLQLEADSSFFKQNKLIDYSLLLGVSKVDFSERETLRDQLERARADSPLVFYSADRRNIYYLCIIDFLTSFTWIRKKAEYALKRTFMSKDISCVPPDHYATRFRDFVTKGIIKFDNDQEEPTLPRNKLNFIPSNTL